jgi:hypothetical protein
MRWNDRRTWLGIAGVIVALLLIYRFASPDQTMRLNSEKASAPPPRRRVATTRPAPGAQLPRYSEIEPLRTDLLDTSMVAAPSRSGRNIFAFVEPPPAPTPPPVRIVELPPPPPPPDRDHDGVPDASDNCPDIVNPDQRDIDRNGIGAACQTTKEIPPPPEFVGKYVGNFGTKSRPIATFSINGEIVNVRLGQTFAGQFILRNIGIESVDIGFVGYPPDVTRRIPIGM